jgi:hypothetical protein
MRILGPALIGMLVVWLLGTFVLAGMLLRRRRQRRDLPPVASLPRVVAPAAAARTSPGSRRRAAPRHQLAVRPRFATRGGRRRGAHACSSLRH